MKTDAQQEGEELLRKAARNLGTFAGQIEQTMEKGQQKLGEIQDAVIHRTRDACETADEYVHAKPWQMVGLAAGLGLIVGLILSRR